jgi:molybdopterin-guanine dinucleotide biosynthesis protein A
MGEGFREVDALVLAGGINRIRLYDGYIPGYKALVPFGGKISLQYVLDALKATRVRRVGIIGPEELRQAVRDRENYEFILAGKTLMESLFTGLEHFRSSAALLCTTADLPLLSPEAIADFLHASAARAAETSGEIFWSLVPERAFTGPFAQATKGFNRFRDIAICHGNLYLFHPEALLASGLRSRLNGLYRSRKSTVRATLVLGPKVGLSYLIGVRLLRVLSLGGMTGLVSRRLGLKLVPILLNHAEVCLDVDEPQDYVLTRKILER